MEDAKRDTDFYFFKGEEEKMRDPIKAIAYYEKALEIDPEHEDALFAHGREVFGHVAGMMWGRGRVVEFIRSINRWSRHAIDWYKRGVGWEIYGARDQAILSYTVAIKMKPRYACAYCRRGAIYETKGEYDKAISDYTKAIEIKPRYVMYYVRRGCAYCSKGEHDKAILEFSKTIEIDQRYAWAYYNRGKAYSKKGEYSRAVSDYSKAIEIDPKAIDYRSKDDYARLRDDVHKAEEMGHQVNPVFLKALREASRRKE